MRAHPTVNNNPTDLRRLRFDESVRSPNWVFIVFGALLGLFAGLLTGLPISGVLEGTESIIFYAVLGVAMLIVLFVMLNFLALLTTISDHGLEFRLGLFARRFAWNQIAGAQAKPYNWLTYLGWGIRIAYGGRRAWSLPGVSHGVEVRVTDPSGRELTYFVSSARSDEFAETLRQGIVERHAVSNEVR